MTSWSMKGTVCKNDTDCAGPQGENMIIMCVTAIYINNQNKHMTSIYIYYII